MAQELDDTTVAEVGHGLIRWLVDEDPGNAARFLPNLEPIDDARATRIGRTVAELLQHIDVA